jgi:hypothetical protein
VPYVTPKFGAKRASAVTLAAAIFTTSDLLVSCLPEMPPGDHKKAMLATGCEFDLIQIKFAKAVLKTKNVQGPGPPSANREPSRSAASLVGAFRWQTVLLGAAV